MLPNALFIYEENSPAPLGTAMVLIDIVGYVCFEAVKCMCQTLGDELSFPGRNLKPRPIDHS